MKDKNDGLDAAVTARIRSLTAQAPTHYVQYDAPGATNKRLPVRAVCGVLVHPQSRERWHNTVETPAPTCAACAQWLEDYENMSF